MGVEAGGVRHRHRGPAQRPLQRPLEVPGGRRTRSRPALGVADADASAPSDGRSSCLAGPASRAMAGNYVPRAPRRSGARLACVERAAPQTSRRCGRRRGGRPPSRSATATPWGRAPQPPPPPRPSPARIAERRAAPVGGDAPRRRRYRPSRQRWSSSACSAPAARVRPSRSSTRRSLTVPDRRPLERPPGRVDEPGRRYEPPASSRGGEPAPRRRTSAGCSSSRPQLARTRPGAGHVRAPSRPPADARIAAPPRRVAGRPDGEVPAAAAGPGPLRSRPAMPTGQRQQRASRSGRPGSRCPAAGRRRSRSTASSGSRRPRPRPGRPASPPTASPCPGRSRGGPRAAPRSASRSRVVYQSTSTAVAGQRPRRSVIQRSKEKCSLQPSNRPPSAPDRLDHRADPAVAAGEQSLDDARLAVVVAEADRPP